MTTTIPTNGKLLADQSRFKTGAREAVEFLRFALGDDVHIGDGGTSGYRIMVSPDKVDCTFAWDSDGAIGWSDLTFDDVDTYEILRHNYFAWAEADTGDFDPEVDENNVMPLGVAIEKCLKALVDWLEWSAERAIRQVMT